MHSFVYSSKFKNTVRKALIKGLAERIEVETVFLVEALANSKGKTIEDYNKLIERLETGESPYSIIEWYPIAGSAYWVEVQRGVMPPGCDTSDMLTVISNLVQKRMPKDIADVGCGTGVLGLSALLAAPWATGVLLDIDPAACELSTRNVERLGISDRCVVVCGDAQQSLVGRELDMIVANLPFIPTEEIEHLSARFRDFAPRIAIDGGLDGYAIFHKLTKVFNESVRVGGIMILQFGSGQREGVLGCLGSRWIECKEDCFGYLNIIVVEKIS